MNGSYFQIFINGKKAHEGFWPYADLAAAVAAAL